MKQIKKEVTEKITVTTDWDLLNIIMVNSPEATVNALNKEKQNA